MEILVSKRKSEASLVVKLFASAVVHVDVPGLRREACLAETRYRT